MAKKRKRVIKKISANVWAKIKSDVYGVPENTQFANSPNNDKYDLVISTCSCMGENENCYRCYGTGIYERKVLKSSTTTLEFNRQDINTNPLKPASFSSDSRGGVYGIREDGRFASLPKHDNYDDESFS